MRTSMFILICAICYSSSLLAKGSDHEKTRVLTLSSGRYEEFFDQDSIERIGSVLYNVNSKKIIGFVEEESNLEAMSADISSRWLSTDPLAAKYPGISPYAFASNNPIYFIDPDGREPVKSHAGTVNGFVSFFNNTRTKMGTLKGAMAGDALLRLGKVKMNGIKPEPATTAPFNNIPDRYIYTEKAGWLDMSHFLFYAGKAYTYKQEKLQAEKIMGTAGFNNMRHGQEGIIRKATMDPVGEAVQDGYMQELGDKIFAPHSAYSYEDLPSDKVGAEFGANYFNPNSELSLGEQLSNYLNDLGATNPESAPNYNDLPADDSKNPPSRTNKTTRPVNTKENP